jgi:hypothetical protein
VDVPNLGVEELLGVILVHEHFTTSEKLFREVTSHFATLSNRAQASEVTLLRYVNFIKNWVKFEREKFRPKGPLGIFCSFFCAVLIPGTLFTNFCNELSQAKWKLLLETTLLEDDSMMSMSLGVLEDSEEEIVFPGTCAFCLVELSLAFSFVLVLRV